MPKKRKVALRFALSSLSALAASLVATSVQAQVATSYNARDPNIVSGSVSFDRGVTAGVETYIVNTPTAVIDFIPNDTATGGGPINFQTAGTTVTYLGGQGVTDYTILNRIVPVDPTRAVQFNGTVRSQLQQAAGGNVWFYSPGGIILGATAAFDVGSLLLTARDPTGGTGTISSTTDFTGGGAAGSSIRVDAGATINATPEGSYVALMAPAVTQGGAVRVNGSAAYVAAEQATLTINNGLFDIVIATGTDTDTAIADTPLYHSGSTGGPATIGTTDHQRIFMVAVPKNDAITMLVRPNGPMGFDPAAGATVGDGVVVLTAGRNIINARIDATGGPLGNAGANVVIDGGNFTSWVDARATTDALAVSTSATPDFAGNIKLQGGARAQLAARQAGETMTIGGDVDLITDGVLAGTALTGGDALLYTQSGGSITVAGSTIIQSDVTSPSSTTGSSATGGQAIVRASGGTIDINGILIVSANAIGGAAGPNGTGATLTGGFAGVEAELGGTVDIGGSMSANANARGSIALAGVSGVSTGGQAYLRTAATGGTIITGNDAYMSAGATGNDSNAAAATGGDAVGGAAYVRAQSGAITITGFASLNGTAVGGNAAVGADGGSATGGNIFAQADAGASITFSNAVSLQSDGAGGTNQGGGDGIGGRGAGGPAAIIAIGDISVAETISITARGTGGAKFAGATGGGGEGQGGRARIMGAGGQFTINGAISIDATGTGGFVSAPATGNGGLGRGGGARLGTISATSTLTATGDVELVADGFGGDGAGAGSVGGNGFGGNQVTGALFNEGAYLVNDAGTLNVTGNVRMSASGSGGDGATGGSGQGGIGYATGFAGPLTLTGSLIGDFDGFGGDALFDVAVGGGNGGVGTGGSFNLGTFAQNGITGSATFENVTLTAVGLGGNGADGLTGVGGRGGDALGGQVYGIAEASANAVVTQILIYSADGNGGDGGDGAAGAAGSAGFAGGAGGAGTGGIVQIGAASGADLPSNTGSATFGAVTLLANGVGGGGGAGGAGGDGTAGTAPNQPGGNGGDGAFGGLGGLGTGGFAAVIDRGTPLTVESVQALVVGLGGDGGSGGAAGIGGTPGTGGTAGSDGAQGLQGDGGVGVGGGAVLSITNRANRPERGSAIIGTVTYTTFGLGGNGNIGGGSTAGEGLLSVVNSDATIDSIAFANNLGGAPATSPAISIEIANGTLAIATTLDVGTSGDIALNIRDGGILRANSLNLFGTGSLLPRAPGGALGAPGLIDLASDFDATFDNGFGTATTLNIGAQLNVTGNVFVSGDQVTLGNIAASGIVQISGQDVQAGALTGGGGISITANAPEFLPPTGGNIVTGTLVAGGGQVALFADNGGITTLDINSAGDVAVSATDAIGTGSISAAGAVTMAGSVVQSGDISGNQGINLLAGLGGADIQLGNVASSDGAILLQSQSGAIRTGTASAGRELTIAAFTDIVTGNLDAATAGFVDADSSTIDVDSSIGAITTGNTNAVEITINQGDPDLGTAANIVAGDLRAEKITVTGLGNITLGNVTGVDLFAGFDPADGLQLVLNAGGGLTAGAVTSQETLILSGRGGSITAGQLATPTSAMILTPFNVTLDGVTTGTTGSDTLYISNTGFSGYDTSFELNDQPFDTALLADATLGATGGSNIFVGPVVTGALRGAGQVMTFGNVDARARVDIFATGNAVFNGAVVAPDISVNSGNIALGEAGQLGNDTTADLRLRAALFGSPVVIGGNSPVDGYHLSDGEAQQIHAHNILIEAVRSGEATSSTDMIVRGLTLTGSAAGERANLVGEGASLRLAAEGLIRVEGAVALDAMRATDRLSMFSGRRIEIATDQGGSIALTGTAPAIGGTLIMEAPVIAAGPASVLEKIAADPNFAGRDTALAAPAAEPRDAGIIQADTLQLTISNLLAIQNSGSAALAGGFTAGAGRMTIAMSEGQQLPSAQVTIWGRLLQPDGTFLTNLNTAGGITFQASAALPFDPAPLVNGCRVGAVCGSARPDPVIEEVTAEIITTIGAIERFLAVDLNEATAIPQIRFARVVDQDGLVTEEIITEPVSGAGNSSLWLDDGVIGGVQ